MAVKESMTITRSFTGQEPLEKLLADLLRTRLGLRPIVQYPESGRPLGSAPGAEPIHALAAQERPGSDAE